MTPQSVGTVDDERRLVEEFYYRSIPVNTGLILAPLLSQNGKMFSTLAVSAYHAGKIHGGELTSLLNLKLKHLGKFESLLYPSRVRSLVESS